MTQTTFNTSTYKPLAMPGPFGYNGSVYTPLTTQNPAKPNFIDGFPSAYGSPKSSGGQYITRAEMNGIGNLASRYEFFRRAGGLVTFDPDFCTKIGGYPYGAVLDYAYNGSLFRVESLVDNNTVNFLQVGIDNINWRILNVAEGDVSITETIVSNISVSQAPGNSIITFFKAKRTGPLVVSGDMRITDDGSNTPVSAPNIGNETYYIARGGYGIGILDLGNVSEPDASNITFPNFTITTASTRSYISWDSHNWGMIIGQLSYAGSGFYSSNTLYSAVNTPAPFLMWVTQGHMYVLAHLRGSTGKVYRDWNTAFHTNTFDVSYKESSIVATGSITLSYGKL